MFSLIRKWESSEQTQEQFFSEYTISKSTFGYWRKKYLKEKATIDTIPKKGFIPVNVDQTVEDINTSCGTIELIYPNGIRLVCNTDMDLNRLKTLLVL